MHSISSKNGKGKGRRFIRLPLVEVPLGEMTLNQVLQFALKLSGKTIAQLADEMGLSPKTIENYLYEPLYENIKLGRFLELARLTCPDLFAEWIRAKFSKAEATPEEASLEALTYMGEVLKDISEALKDGVITKEEILSLKPLVIELQEQLSTLLKTFEKEGK